jgi:hypothetical protein
MAHRTIGSPVAELAGGLFGGCSAAANCTVDEGAVDDNGAVAVEDGAVEDGAVEDGAVEDGAVELSTGKRSTTGGVFCLKGLPTSARAPAQPATNIAPNNSGRWHSMRKQRSNKE